MKRIHSTVLSPNVQAIQSLEQVEASASLTLFNLHNLISEHIDRVLVINLLPGRALLIRGSLSTLQDFPVLRAGGRNRESQDSGKPCHPWGMEY